MELTILAFIIVISILIYKILKKNKHNEFAGVKYEETVKEIYKCLLKKNPELNIEQAKPIIYSIIDEKWFRTLDKNQIENIVHRIEVYLRDKNDDIAVSDLIK